MFHITLCSARCRPLILLALPSLLRQVPAREPRMDARPLKSALKKKNSSSNMKAGTPPATTPTGDKGRCVHVPGHHAHGAHGQVGTCPRGTRAGGYMPTGIRAGGYMPTGTRSGGYMPTGGNGSCIHAHGRHYNITLNVQIINL